MSMRPVIVAGALANKPANGGEAWVRLSWARGLRRLGFDVFLFEQIDPRSCTDASGRSVSFAESFNRQWFARIVERFGFRDRAALICSDLSGTYGLDAAEIDAVADAAVLLINISGNLSLDSILSRIRRRAYVDIDPGFTQFWNASGRIDSQLAGHDMFFTIGENIGTNDCPIPVDGIRWRAVRQPVVLDDWPVTPPASPNRFTTVASWRGAFGPVQAGGRRYGLKVHEFRRFMELPERAAHRFEIALDIHPADATDLDSLHRHGWRITDPRSVAQDPDLFRAYVQGSAAEFSVAQGIYVETRCGWFSDRTARYLASGRPALVQNTGFDRRLPTGEGLIAFDTLDQAIEGADRIVADHAHHARAARAIAEEYFDSDRVLTALIEEAGVAP
jgi:hypothetical protein